MPGGASVSTAVAMQKSPKYAAIRKMEAAIPQFLETISIDSLTKHEWCDGVYRSEFFLPKDAIVVSKIHQLENWFLLFSGEISIASGDGTTIRVKAPYMSKTEVNTKRVVYAHEDSMMYTFHGNPDNESDLEVLEARYIKPEEPIALPAPGPRALLKRK